MINLDGLEAAGLFAQPPSAIGESEARDFYHVMDLPGLGSVGGAWDLRGNLDVYLGRVELAGATVLDIGASDGFLAVEMERRGGHVVSVDLPASTLPDYFPLPGLPPPVAEPGDGRVPRRRRSYWTTRRLTQSLARLHEAHAGRVDPRLSGFDVAIIGNVLQHLRDPITVLLDISTRADRLVVTEADWLAGTADASPSMTLFTDNLSRGRPESWFMVSPQLAEDVLRLTGFTIVARDIHEQLFVNRGAPPAYPVRHYTITAERPFREGRT